MSFYEGIILDFVRNAMSLVVAYDEDWDLQ